MVSHSVADVRIPFASLVIVVLALALSGCGGAHQTTSPQSHVAAPAVAAVCPYVSRAAARNALDHTPPRPQEATPGCVVRIGSGRALVEATVAINVARPGEGRAAMAQARHRPGYAPATFPGGIEGVTAVIIKPNEAQGSQSEADLIKGSLEVNVVLTDTHARAPLLTKRALALARSVIARLPSR